MWHKLSAMLNEVENLEDKELYASGCVGIGVAKELIAFIRTRLKVNLNDILANPSRIKDITSIDLKYSVTS